MVSKNQTDIAHLRQRIQELEAIEREHTQFRELLDYAAKNESLEKYANEIVLYVVPHTKQIFEASSSALVFLGYSREQLSTMTIDDLEVEGSKTEIHIYVESSLEFQIYDCCFRHHDGYDLNVKARKWFITKNEQSLLCYTLEDKSIRTQLWHELSRREDADYQFQEKLKNLNEITIDLGHLEAFDDICKKSVELGIQKLGFDRLALFFLSPSKTLMTGSFGVDEQGNIRDERGQSWGFAESFIMDFVNGKREPVIKHDSAPLYNQFSEIVGYGWHVSVPIIDNGKFIGFITTDNLLNKQPLQNYQPDLLRIYGDTIGHLISRQVEQETIRKLSSAVQHSSSMIIVVNTKQIVEFANDAFCRLSGYLLHEVLGEDLATLFPIESFQTIKQTLESGQAWHGELINYKKNGEAYETFVSISPVHLGNTIENFVIVQEDVTLLKEAQQKELALQLEKERAHMLQTFVTDIGHEFKTPLSIIHTSNYIVAKSNDVDKQQKHLVRVQEQVDVLAEMLDDILEIVTLTSTLELKSEIIWLGSFIQGIINEMMPSAKGKNITWKIDLDSTTALEADAHKLMRVVQEILENAIQFTPADGTIFVGFKIYEKQLGIIIRDTGIGIPADEIDKIFHRFYRVDKARTLRSTGLGLAIAKLLVDEHQGKIVVESVLGKGSCFEIILPTEFKQREL